MNDLKYSRNGHITVFLSLILTLILSVVCTTIESARLQGAHMQLQNITDMGIYSAFGEYNRDLLELYDLFFIDMGYGTKDSSMERVNARIKEYLQYNTNVDKGLPTSFLRRADMWRANIESVATDQYVLATDHKGKAYYSQAVSYMKDKLGMDVAKKLLAQYDHGILDAKESFENAQEESNNKEQSLESEKQDYQEKYNAALEEANGDESKVVWEKPTKASNPVDTIKTLKSSPILGLVMEDDSSLSHKKIKHLNQVPSKRELKKGNGTFQGEKKNGLSDAIFNEYLFEKFPNFLSDRKDDLDTINYQAEYILCGKDSDKANLQGTVNKLLLIREGINFAYLSTNRVKDAEAFSLAMAIVGYLGVPFAEILKYAILLAWAFAESLIEVRMLLQGKKVALLKNDNNWNLGLSNLANVSNLLDCGKEDRKGIDYEGYLKILIFFESRNKKVLRSLDMIELTIRAKNKNFRVDNCTQGFTTSIQYNIGSLFLRLPFKTINRGKNNYSFNVTRDFSYY